MRSLSVNRRWRAAVIAVAALTLALLLLKLAPGDFLGPWRGWIEKVLEQVRRVPFPAFIPLAAVLPLAGVPVTALYLAAGAVYAPVYGMGWTLAGVAVSLLINLLLSYALARIFRGPARRLLERRGWKLPGFPEKSAWKFILLVRITPGAPLIAQNLLLGLAAAPIGLYLLVSMPAEILIALGYLTAGSSFATGRSGFLVLGAGITIAMALIVSILRDRSKAAGHGGEST